MFENVIEQQTIKLLIDDITAHTLPPSILFSGPEAAGKLTTALELSRIVSCTGNAEWSCACPSCLKQREMTSPDLIIIGQRDTGCEIRAAAHAFLSAKTIPSRYLFIRSIRKLTARFDARLWEPTETRFLKAAPLLATLDEELVGFIDATTKTDSTIDYTKIEKQIDKICATAEKLQHDCMYESIPIDQVRKVSAWVRLMPIGKRKTVIIENADKMQESARNAFLKILEEPPEYATFILTTARRAAIIPTILSRVRTYAFVDRSFDAEKEVIERVFRAVVPDEKNFGQVSLLQQYLYSFLPVSEKDIKEAAALFLENMFERSSAQKKAIPETLFVSVQTYRKTILPKTGSGISEIIKLLQGCKSRTVYRLFLAHVILFLREGLRAGTLSAKETETYANFSKLLHTAQSSVDIFNLSPQAVLENCAEQMKEVC
ncbi:hypothetical protein [Treponema phagedenis]|uniref:hypothetical protein n=1 Tax=Treponema phagedenis TaxID=162 RepID=UPI0015842E99|nr:hypothetical protein [Treponema phagedenis]QKS92736.1 hypothetical protein HPJ96_09385 [Treponema phagedenis]